MFLLFCLLPLLSSQGAEAQPTKLPTQVNISLANLLDTTSTFSMDDLDYYINIISDFPDYVPLFVKTLTQKLPQSVKQEMVAMVNEVEVKKFVIPNNETEIFNYIKAKSPQYYKRIEQALMQIMDILGALSDNTKKGFEQWWKRGVAAISGDDEGRANRIAQFISDFYIGFNAADAATQADVKNASPEIYNLMTSNFARQIAKASKAFVDAGLTANIRSLYGTAQYPPPITGKVKTA